MPGVVGVAEGGPRAGGQPLDIRLAWAGCRGQHWVGYLTGGMVRGLLAPGSTPAGAWSGPPARLHHAAGYLAHWWHVRAQAAQSCTPPTHVRRSGACAASGSVFSPKIAQRCPCRPALPCMALFMPNNSLDNFFTQRAPGDARCIQWRRGVAGGRWSGRGRRGQRWAACPAAASARCLLLAAWRHSKCQPLAAIHFLILPGSSSMAASELACWMHSVRNWHCSSKVMSRCSSSLSSLRCAGPNTP